MNDALSDQDLDNTDMQRLCSGHDGSLNDLMDRHGKRLFHYLLRLLQSEEEAADIAQETFSRIYQSRFRFNPKQKFSTWLYSIGTNLAKNELRRRARHPAVSLEEVTLPDGGDFREGLSGQNPSPSALIQAAERVELVRQAISKLPQDHRVPLILFEYEEKSHAEIGTILGCSPKAVEMRIYRARKLLEESLARLLQPA